MKRKGFTLIELLAVIVILAIIAVIATPIITSIIEDSKKSAIESSAKYIIKAAETHYARELMNEKTVIGINLSNDTLKYSGTHAQKGYLYFKEDGIAYGKMYINGFCINILEDESLTIEKVNISECKINIPTKSGETYYYNPVTNTACTMIEAKQNTSKNEGCLKWYSYLDDGGDTLKLLLSHNSSSNVPWISKSDFISAGGSEIEYGETGNNTKGPITVTNQLKIDIQNWNSTVKETARLIKGQEIADITENDEWNAGSSKYYMHDKSLTPYVGEVGTNKYAWLFDNTKGYDEGGCEVYGCNVSDSSTWGYWTDTAATNNTVDAWRIIYDGSFRKSDVYYEDFSGVRPVIEVVRTIFE